jgi:hypothetical protein
MNERYFDFAVSGGVPRTDAQIERAKRMAVGGRRKRCTRGKSCSATCIAGNKICLVDLPWVANTAINKVRARLLKKAPLTSQEKEKAISGDLGALFNKAIEQGKKEKAPSVPPDLKAQLWGLGPAKKNETDLILDDISRIMRGSAPQNIEIASDRGPEGFKARAKTGGAATPIGATTGNTRWAREDAQDFDNALQNGKAPVRREGDRNYNGWDDSYKSGASKVGEGSYGTVIRNPDGTYVKRGDISDTEAKLIDRLGKADLGPKLIAADIDGKAQYHDEDFVNIRNGRIAMGAVPGKPIGEATAGTKVLANGVIASDAYWKALADLHRMGIAHNDAHIDNILVDNKGKGRWVDLGLAQASPKAALAEALGVFGNTIQNVDPYRNMPSDAAGHLNKRERQVGNWQTARWDGTGVPAFQRLRSQGRLAEAEKTFPLLTKFYDNRNAVQYALIKEFPRAEVASIMEHGIRSPLETYNQGPWAKMTDQQAQKYLDMLYDGI